MAVALLDGRGVNFNEEEYFLKGALPPLEPPPFNLAPMGGLMALLLTDELW